MIPVLSLHEVRVLCDVAHRTRVNTSCPVSDSVNVLARLVALGYLAAAQPPMMSTHGRFYSITEKGYLRLTDPSKLLALEVLDT